MQFLRGGEQKRLSPSPPTAPTPRFPIAHPPTHPPTPGNINYTNVCTYGCRFCAFSKGRASDELRGSPYLMSLDEVARRVGEAAGRGATEVCMQGGIHPEFTGDTYLRILEAAKVCACVRARARARWRERGGERWAGGWGGVRLCMQQGRG